VVDPCAHGIAPHLEGIIGPDEFGDSIDVSHPRIEPEVAAIGIEDHGHTIMDG
jgi:hypothetical protein